VTEPNGSSGNLLAASIPSPRQLRAELEDLIARELLGPRGGPDEEIADERLQDRYLLGMLAPKYQRIRAAQMDVLSEDGAGSAEDGTTDDPGFAVDSLMPASIGLTCTIRGDASDLKITARWGRYQREKSATLTTDKGAPQMVWKRYPVAGERIITLSEGDIEPSAIASEQPDVVIQGQIRRIEGDWIVTVFLVNGQQAPERLKDEAWIFQPEIALSAPDGAAVFHRRHQSRDAARLDPVRYAEQKALEMLYRHHVEFAVGHGVAVHAETDLENPSQAHRIVTRVMPVYEVPLAAPPTAEDIPALGDLVLDMQVLAEMDDDVLVRTLGVLPAAYRDWIAKERARIGDPGEGLAPYRDAAEAALAACTDAGHRIEAGIALLAADAQARQAFRFANRAMWQQRVRQLYSEAKRAGREAALEDLDASVNRSWRPFQLAFILLNLPGVTRLDHPDRNNQSNALADLLWFPTGGGKTEAYLGLTAYTLAIRRLQGVVGGRLGHAGVAVIMRYTLRLLTLQQFQRAAALICACEVIRRGDATTWGDEPFRIGLWVGQRVTPNTLQQAREAILQDHGHGPGGGAGTPLQLTNCPWCGSALERGRDVRVETFSQGRARVLTYCSDPIGQCDFSAACAASEGLPVLTVDEEIYRRLPALLIATVDKFAQMPWNGCTQMLFGQVNGYCPRHGFRSPCLDDSDSHPARRGQPAVRSIQHGPLRPPDLIIQDELHLISGPLGSLVGLYETAVDQLCTWEIDGRSVRPKLIASTATIRQAQEQVRSLFLREVRVFPPPGLDARDSFFSVLREPDDKDPGRRYVGVCALGRRLKVALIRVYTAYLAASQFLFLKYGKAIDPWMTLAGYFNSIRELGGMRRMVDDDVRSRLKDMDTRGLAKRHTPILDELTSRKSSRDIPALLDRLEIPHDPALPPHAKAKPRQTMPLDVVLATNMVSVGVDIKRLGLMVVAGQPKSTAEYIQATSRIGRHQFSPGIVCTVYNWARPRDLSHYERFEHYHATFYRHVEALSVTPFAARAIDRGLAAVLASLIRLPAPEYNDNDAAGRVDRAHAIVQAAIAGIASRAAEVRQSNAEGARMQQLLQARMDAWLRQAAPRQGGARLGYQAERDGVTVGLLQRPGIGDWQDFTCLNSLRDVEPNVTLVLDDRVIDDGRGPNPEPP
jgi:hypothetical protein